MSVSTATGRSHMVVYYFMWPACQILSPCNCFTLSLRVAIVVVAIVGDGNHGGGAIMSMMMEIIPVLWRWRSKAQEEKAISYHNL